MHALHIQHNHPSLPGTHLPTHHPGILNHPLPNPPKRPPQTSRPPGSQAITNPPSIPPAPLPIQHNSSSSPPHPQLSTFQLSLISNAMRSTYDLPSGSPP